MAKQSHFYKCEIKAVDRTVVAGGSAKLPERSLNKWRDVCLWHKADIGHYRYQYRGAKPVQTLYSLNLFGGSLSRLRRSRTPFASRNSTPCFSNVTLIALRFRSCMRGLPSTLSAREIAECDTPHRLASSRADQLRSARAARNCAPVIVSFKASDPQKWPLTRDIPPAPVAEGRLPPCPLCVRCRIGIRLENRRRRIRTS